MIKNKTRKIQKALMLGSLMAITTGAMTGCVQVVTNQDCAELPKTKIDDFSSIELRNDYANVKIEESDDYYLEYKYYYNNKKPTYEVKDGKLIIDADNVIKSSAIINDSSKSFITVYVPKDSILSNLDVASDSGNVDINIPKIDNATIDVDSGDLCAKTLSGDKFTAVSDSGNITIDGLTSDTASFTADTGDVDLSNVNAKTNSVNSNMGTVTVKDSEGDTMDVKTDSGDVDLSDSLYSSINADLETGAFKLDATADADQYSYNLKTDSGDIDVNGNSYEESYKSEAKDKNITVHTDSGNISIDLQ